MWILLCAAMFILVIYLAVRVYSLKKGVFDRRDSLIILRKRLASGEISIEEYETLKKVL